MCLRVAACLLVGIILCSSSSYYYYYYYYYSYYYYYYYYSADFPPRELQEVAERFKSKKDRTRVAYDAFLKFASGRTTFS